MSALDFDGDVWDLDRLSALKYREEDGGVNVSPDQLLERSLSLMHCISKGANIASGSEDDADDSLASWAVRARRASMNAAPAASTRTPPKSPSLGTICSSHTVLGFDAWLDSPPSLHAVRPCAMRLLVWWDGVKRLRVQHPLTNSHCFCLQRVPSK